eukprot:PhM_4_TR8764/c0_g1_i5/m.37074
MLSRSSSGGGGGQNSFSQSSSLGRSFVPILGSQRAHSLLLVQQRAAEARDPYTALLMCFFTPTLEDSVKSDAVATLCNELKIDKASAVFNSYPVRPGRSPQPGQNLNNSTDLDIIYVPRMEDSYVAAPNEIAFAPFRSVHRVLGSWVFVLFSIPFMVGTTLATTLIVIFGDMFDALLYVFPLVGFFVMICQLLRYNRSLVLHSLAKFNTWFYGLALILIHMIVLFSNTKPSLALARVPYGIVQALFVYCIDASPYSMRARFMILAFFSIVMLYSSVKYFKSVEYFYSTEAADRVTAHRSNPLFDTTLQCVYVVMFMLQFFTTGVFPLCRRYFWGSQLLHWTCDVTPIRLSSHLSSTGAEFHYISVISGRTHKDVKIAMRELIDLVGACHVDVHVFCVPSADHKVILPRGQDGYFRSTTTTLYTRHASVLPSVLNKKIFWFSQYCATFGLYMLLGLSGLSTSDIGETMFYICEAFGLVSLILLMLSVRPSVFMHLPKHSDFLVATAAFVFLEAARLHGQSTRYNIAPGFVGVVCVVSCVLRWVVWLGVDALPLGHKSRRAVYVGAAATYLVTVITHLTVVVDTVTLSSHQSDGRSSFTEAFQTIVRVDGLFDTSLQSIVVSCGIVLFLYSVRSGVRAHRGCEAYMRMLGTELFVPTNLPNLFSFV